MNEHKNEKQKFENNWTCQKFSHVAQSSRREIKCSVTARVTHRLSTWDAVCCY